MEITLESVISYVSKYLLAFVICILGAFTKQAYTAVKRKQTINLLQVLAPSIFGAFVMTAAQDHWKLSFATYALANFIIGMNTSWILDVFTSKQVLLSALAKFSAKSSDAATALAGSLAQAALEEDDDKSVEETKSSNDSKKTTTDNKKDESKTSDTHT